MNFSAPEQHNTTPSNESVAQTEERLAMKEFTDVVEELLNELPDVSEKTKIDLHTVLNTYYKEKYNLVGAIAEYLNKKNRNIFEMDALVKQGHEIGKSFLIKELAISDEDMQLYEWFRQIRM